MVHGTLQKEQAAARIAELMGANDAIELRARGFIDNQTCLLISAAHNCIGLCSGSSSMHSSPDGEKMLASIASKLDPEGIFSSVPLLWE